MNTKMVQTNTEVAAKVSKIFDVDLMRQNCEIKVQTDDFSKVVVSAAYNGSATEHEAIASELAHTKLAIIANTAGAMLAMGYSVEYMDKIQEDVAAQLSADESKEIASVCYIATVSNVDQLKA